MALRGKKKETKREKREREQWLPAIHETFTQFPSLLVSRNTKVAAMLAELRATYIPSDDGLYFHHPGGEFAYDNFDELPINSINRSVAGFLSYLISPSETFFSARPRKGLEDDKGTDIPKELAKRERVLHSLVQNRDNMAVYARNYRDKVILSLTGKVIWPDKDSVVRFEYFEPENLLLASTNGKSFDVYGVRTQLTEYQAYLKFPVLRDKLTRGEGISSLGSGSTRDYYFLNIPRRALYHHILINSGQINNLDFVRYLRRALGISLSGYKETEDDKWVHLWFSNQDFISMEVMDYRNVIISQFTPGHRTLGIGKGLGELCLTTHMLLTEIEVLNLGAYEKSTAPPKAVSSESAASELNFGRDGIFIYEGQNDKPEYMQLKVDGRFLIDYKNYLQARFDRSAYLDVFQLINKSRMTEREVAIRDTESMRTLVGMVIQDQFDDLNPTLNVCNYIYNQQTKEPRSAYLDNYLDVTFVSPLATAHKNSYLSNVSNTLSMVKEVMELDNDQVPLTDSLNFNEFTKKLLIKLDQTNLLEGDQMEMIKKKIRASRQELLDKKEQMETLRSANQVAIEAQGAEQETPPQEETLTTPE